MIWARRTSTSPRPPRTPPVGSTRNLVGIAGITDGTSNTLAVSELIIGSVGTDFRGFSQWGDAAGFTTNIGPNSSSPDVHDYSTAGRGDPPLVPLGNLGVNDKYYAARSRHPGGVNTAMCDGSVRFAKNSINIFIWRALSTTNGGEVISSDAF